jgi:CRP-like cAMP-binding protein
LSASSKYISVLKRIKFFQDLETRVQDKLPSICTMENIAAETVIFQQDDPPGNCYVLVSGEVGIHVKPMRNDQEEDDEKGNGSRIPSRIPEARRATLAARPKSRQVEEQNDDSSQPADSRAGSKRNSFARFIPVLTAEGFSTFSGDVAELGFMVASLRGGTIFGELALINDQPRGASIRCNTDCDLLVIRRDDFNRVLKEEMQRAGDEKMRFLAMHVPGMRDIEIPRISGKGQPHPAYFLRHQTYRRGHMFFSQGAVAHEAAIYVVFKGSVELRHREAVKPYSIFDDESPAATTRSSANTRRRTGRQALQALQKGRGYSTTRGADANDSTHGNVRVCGTLMSGSAFGSMPVQAPEPYTVIVSSTQCEVFQAVGGDVSKLPRHLLEAIREYIANTTAWRLRTYMNQKKDFKMPKAPTRSESPTVSDGPRDLQELKYFSLIHATGC